MKQWAILVVVLYAVILAALFFPVVGAAFSVSPLKVAFKAVPEPWFQLLWQSWVVVMAACQAALLVVPVRMAERRPVTRRHVIWPILVGLFSVLLLGVAMFVAVYEFFERVQVHPGWMIASLATVVVVWLTWAFLFGFYCGRSEPRTFMSRFVRLLIAGSILELLVAVPTHVYSRAKDDCCGGYLTIWGIGLGISVMLFAFGPGVFFLFVRRWASLRPSQPDPPRPPDHSPQSPGDGGNQV